MEREKKKGKQTPKIFVAGYTRGMADLTSGHDSHDVSGQLLIMVHDREPHPPLNLQAARTATGWFASRNRPAQIGMVCAVN